MVRWWWCRHACLQIPANTSPHLTHVYPVATNIPLTLGLILHSFTCGRGCSPSLHPSVIFFEGNLVQVRTIAGPLHRPAARGCVVDLGETDRDNASDFQPRTVADPLHSCQSVSCWSGPFLVYGAVRRRTKMSIKELLIRVIRHQQSTRTCIGSSRQAHPFPPSARDGHRAPLPCLTDVMCSVPLPETTTAYSGCEQSDARGGWNPSAGSLQRRT